MQFFPKYSLIPAYFINPPVISVLICMEAAMPQLKMSIHDLHIVIFLFFPSVVMLFSLSLWKVVIFPTKVEIMIFPTMVVLVPSEV